MIRSFADKDTERLYARGSVRRFHTIERVALRKLVVLNAATALVDLKAPGFSLEALKAGRKGQHAIRINEQWRICFVWKHGDAHAVEVVDYH